MTKREGTAMVRCTESEFALLKRLVHELAQVTSQGNLQDLFYRLDAAETRAFYKGEN